MSGPIGGRPALKLASELAAWPTPGPLASLTKWAEIDSDAIAANVATLIAITGTQVMVMVKANGYGHGALLTADAAQRGGATWLGVSAADEGLQLRNAGINLPVLVVGWTPPGDAADLVAAEIDIAVLTPEAVIAVAEAAEDSGRRARVQVKFDTGMSRLGVREDAIEAMHAALQRHADALEITGLFTHFAASDSDDAFTRQQNQRFVAAADRFRELAPTALRHAANSDAALRLTETRHDLVRCGIAVYGYGPRDCDAPLRPALRWRARITGLRTLSAGETVGYGRAWTAPGSVQIATVAVGYGDGLARAQGNHGSVVVRGQICPIVGRVSMDQVGVDVSAVAGLNVGDVVDVLGPGLDANAVATAAGTINYEVLTGISARVPRLLRLGQA